MQAKGKWVGGSIPFGYMKDLNDKNEVEVKKVEVEENSEVIIPKRYHRRYRETKTSTNKDN